MKPVISVALMRKSDACTIENLIPSKQLMYRAGKAVFDAAKPKDGSVIVCGSGNNAGDGYVIALEMAKAGLKSTLLLVEDKFSQDGMFYFEKCKKEGIEYIYADENTSLSPYNEIVDCIFGTGFKGEPHGIAGEIIEKINASGKRVISVDINSGLNGDNGLYTKCVKSDLTVSIGYLKTGFFLGNAHEVIGQLTNVDIGIELSGKPYFLVDSAEELPSDYTYAELSESSNPIESLISLAPNNYIRWKNIVTNGSDTYILAGGINSGN